MVTVSEFLRQRAEEEKALREKTKAEFAEVLAAAERVFTVRSTGTRESAMESLRRAALTGSGVTLHDFVCDFCGTRMINPTPGRVLLSHPPQCRAECSGCGFITSVPA